MRENHTLRGITRRDFLAGAAAVAGAAALPASAVADFDGAVARGNRYRLQRAIVEDRFGMFIHFNMGTFHDMEWVNPNQDPRSFSEDGARFREVARGQWAPDHTLKQARFFPARGRYVRLEALATAGGGAAVASEIDCGGADDRPRGGEPR